MVLFVVLSALSLLVGTYQHALFAVCGLCLVVVARHFWHRPAEERVTVLSILIVALVVRVLAIVIVPEAMDARFGIRFTTGSDPVGFHETASRYATDPREGWKPLRAGRTHLAVLVTLYETFGANPLWPRLLNLLATVPLVLYGYDLAKSAFDDATGSVTGIMLALFPSLILLTVRIGDDVLSIAGTVVGVYYLTQVKREPVRAVTAAAGTTLILYFLRDQMAYVLVAVATVYFAVEAVLLFDRRYGLLTTQSMGVGLCILSLGGVVILAVGGESLLTLVTKWALNNVDLSETGLATALRGAPLPVRVVLGPFALSLMPFPPWEVLLSTRRSPAYFFAASSIVLYLLYPFLLFGVRSTFSTEHLERSAILVFLCATSLGIAAVYAGTVPRFRTTVEPFAIVLIAAGLLRARNVGRLYAVYGTLFVGFTVGYYLVFA